MEVEQEEDKKITGAVYLNIPFFVESMVGISHEKGNRHKMGHLEDIPKMEVYLEAKARPRYIVESFVWKEGDIQNKVNNSENTEYSEKSKCSDNCPGTEKEEEPHASN